MAIARERLRDMPGAADRLERDLHEARGQAWLTLAEAMPAVYALGERTGHPKATALIQEHLTGIIDRWAKAQPQPAAVQPLASAGQASAASPIAAAAPGVLTAPAAKECKEARQDRRLLACESAGLVMPASPLGRLPPGIAKVAAAEGVKRQSFSTDIKAALERRAAASREGLTRHRIE